MGQGLLVFGPDRRLVASNNQFFELNDIPLDRFKEGDRFEELLRFLIARGDFGPGDAELLLKERVAATEKTEPYFFRRTRPDGRVIEFEGRRMPDGGDRKSTRLNSSH